MAIRWQVRHSVAALFLALAARPALGSSVYTFSYVSTTNNAYNDHVHLLNTGIWIDAGNRVDLAGSGVILVGGPHWVMSNFDMGLISPLSGPELMRDYFPDGELYLVSPVPLEGESVLFIQDRASLSDRHDLDVSAEASSSGYLFIGMFDNPFADNRGDHSFLITVVPEPACGLLLALAIPWMRRR
jgi:hypothetical protein